MEILVALGIIGFLYWHAHQSGTTAVSSSGSGTSSTYSGPPLWQQTPAQQAAVASAFQANLAAGMDPAKAEGLAFYSVGVCATGAIGGKFPSCIYPNAVGNANASYSQNQSQITQHADGSVTSQPAPNPCSDPTDYVSPNNDGSFSCITQAQLNAEPHATIGNTTPIAVGWFNRSVQS